MSDKVLICGRIEGLAASFRSRPWPVKRITYHVAPDGYHGNLPIASIMGAFRDAWLDWADMIDIEPVEVPSESQAMVRIKFGAVDGARSVLAWSELSDGTTTPKRQLYDSAENWSWEANPTNRIDLQRVAAHELGHVLGLTHDNDDADALLAPMYSTQIRSPRPRDIARMQTLGYNLRPLVPPVSPGTPSTPTTPAQPPGGVLVDKATILKIVDFVFTGLRSAFASKPIMLFAINAAYSMVKAWIDSLQAMTTGVEELNVDRVRQIIGFIFALLKQWGGPSAELTASFDEMQATALNMVQDTVAALRAENITVK